MKQLSDWRLFFRDISCVTQDGNSSVGATDRRGVESNDDVQRTGSAASAWLVPSPQGGMRLIRR